jgi:hypothetical protein
MSISFYIGSMFMLILTFVFLFRFGLKHFKKEEDRYENKKSK